MFWDGKVCQLPVGISGTETNLQFPFSYLPWWPSRRTICHHRYLNQECGDLHFLYSLTHVPKAPCVFHSVLSLSIFKSPFQFFHSVIFQISLEFWGWNTVVFGKNRKEANRSTSEWLFSLAALTEMENVWVTIGVSNLWHHLCAALLDGLGCWVCEF